MSIPWAFGQASPVGRRSTPLAPGSPLAAPVLWREEERQSDDRRGTSVF